jgi:hypothetical protein
MGIYTALNRLGFNEERKQFKTKVLPEPGSPVMTPKPRAFFKKSNRFDA